MGYFRFCVKRWGKTKKKVKRGHKYYFGGTKV
jgi:hypothetical protein